MAAVQNVSCSQRHKEGRSSIDQNSGNPDMEDDIKRVNSTRLLIELKYLSISHIIVNTAVILLWVLAITFYLQDIILIDNVNPFELTLYVVNLVYLVFLIYQINRRNIHQLVKNQLDSLIETVLLCLAVLVIFYSMKQGVNKSSDQILYYLSYLSTVKSFETKLLEIVTLFPGFISAYLLVILYHGYKIYKGICFVNDQLRDGSTLSEVAKVEMFAADVNKY